MTMELHSVLQRLRQLRAPGVSWCDVWVCDYRSYYTEHSQTQVLVAAVILLYHINILPRNADSKVGMKSIDLFKPLSEAFPLRRPSMQLSSLLAAHR